MCGTINPTKLIGPARAVTVAQSKTPENAAMAFVRFTFRPSAVAVSSERRMVSRLFDSKMLMIIPIRINGSTSFISSKEVPPMLPICQNLYVVMTLEFGITIRLTKEDRAVLVAAPAMASFIGVGPPYPADASLYTNRAVIIAPIKDTPI